MQPPTTPAPRLVLAGLQGVVEGLRDAVHVPLHPAADGVLDLTGVMFHPEAFALSAVARGEGVEGGCTHCQAWT